jgi:hypothetical protein
MMARKTEIYTVRNLSGQYLANYRAQNPNAAIEAFLRDQNIYRSQIRGTVPVYASDVTAKAEGWSMALKPLPIRFCAECGEPFHVTQPNKIYCDGGCRQAAWNRRITGGFKLYDLAMRWRIDREKGDMAELTAAADLFAAEERIIRKRRQANIDRNRKGLPAGSGGWNVAMGSNANADMGGEHG